VQYGCALLGIEFHGLLSVPGIDFRIFEEGERSRASHESFDARSGVSVGTTSLARQVFYALFTLRRYHGGALDGAHLSANPNRRQIVHQRFHHGGIDILGTALSGVEAVKIAGFLEKFFGALWVMLSSLHGCSRILDDRWTPLGILQWSSTQARTFTPLVLAVASTAVASTEEGAPKA
jgi:hypothetical protein